MVLGVFGTCEKHELSWRVSSSHCYIIQMRVTARSKAKITGGSGDRNWKMSGLVHRSWILLYDPFVKQVSTLVLGGAQWVMCSSTAKTSKHVYLSRKGGKRKSYVYLKTALNSQSALHKQHRHFMSVDQRAHTSLHYLWVQKMRIYAYLTFQISVVEWEWESWLIFYLCVLVVDSSCPVYLLYLSRHLIWHASIHLPPSLRPIYPESRWSSYTVVSCHVLGCHVMSCHAALAFPPFPLLLPKQVSFSLTQPLPTAAATLVPCHRSFIHCAFVRMYTTTRSKGRPPMLSK